jgi:hypothetical protein
MANALTANMATETTAKLIQGDTSLWPKKPYLKPSIM